MKIFHLAVAFCPLLLSACAIGPVLVQDEPIVRAKLDNPKVCVALSGGGLRSAAFSTGVLRGLERQMGLKNVDVISSTSGGTWAQLWLHGQLSAGHSLADIYGPDGSPSTKLLDDLESRTFIDPFWKGWTAFWGPATLGTVGASSSYFAAISGKFGRFSGVPVKALAENVVRHGIAVPVITAATFPPCGEDAADADRYGSKGPPLNQRLAELLPMSEHLVEFTPLGWGSRTRGYTGKFPFELRDVEHWAKVSSAVIDAPGYRKCETLRALGFKFGEFVPTPGTSEKPLAEQHKIYLADGGFVDNLSARNLIERGCKSILIVDAEHDPTFAFEAYQRLKIDLWSSMQQKLLVPAIDMWLSRPEPGHCTSHGPCFEADNENRVIVQQPMQEGCVTGSTCETPEISIQYLKLSINPVLVKAGRLQREVTEFYKKGLLPDACGTEPRGQSRSCSFPHTPTFQTNYSREEFRAYRMLGEDMVRLHLSPNGLSKRR